VSTLTIEGLSKRFGGTFAVEEVSLSVAEGEFVALLGPSGCGKTTILRMVAGLAEPDSGRILIGQRDVTWVQSHKRQVGLVFQSYALFPHMTVFDNIAFGLRRQKRPDDEVRGRVAEALEMVRLSGFAERLPGALSGGQQQRVALARAIAPQPSLLLLDEPLSNLDAQLRDEMQVELKRLQNDLGITTLFVTHDQAEALAMSDRVCVLDQGRLQQVGTPEEIYQQPANSFVARFLGRSNSFTGTLSENGPDGATILLEEGLRLQAGAVDQPPGTPVVVTLRQENVSVSGEAAPGTTNSFPGTVAFRAFAGPIERYVIRVADGLEILAEAPSLHRGKVFSRDAEVTVTLPPEALIVSPARGDAAS
jgi:spermidine/putrescine ABC transporter ATP-binding subunit